MKLKYLQVHFHLFSKGFYENHLQVRGNVPAAVQSQTPMTHSYLKERRNRWKHQIYAGQAF